jgi:hypothetical protein
VRDAIYLDRADVVWQRFTIDHFDHQEPRGETADVDDPQILVVEGDLLDCNFLVAVMRALGYVKVENGSPRETFDVDLADQTQIAQVYNRALFEHI